MSLRENLDVGHIDFRVGQTNDYNGTYYATLLAYKDARVDMVLLDDNLDHWQNEYRRDSQGVLQCGIGIYKSDIEQWVWKWSNGTPSQFEAVKGEYSDAFKRAGFMWGIGRDLYDYPQIRITLNEEEVINGKPSFKFQPNKWDWYWVNKEGKKSMKKPDEPGYSLEAWQVNKNGSKVNRFKSNPHFSQNQR